MAARVYMTLCIQLLELYGHCAQDAMDICGVNLECFG